MGEATAFRCGKKAYEKSRAAEEEEGEEEKEEDFLDVSGSFGFWQSQQLELFKCDKGNKDNSNLKPTGGFTARHEGAESCLPARHVLSRTVAPIYCYSFAYRIKMTEKDDNVIQFLSRCLPALLQVTR